MKKTKHESINTRNSYTQSKNAQSLELPCISPPTKQAAKRLSEGPVRVCQLTQDHVKTLGAEYSKPTIIISYTTKLMILNEVKDWYQSILQLRVLLYHNKGLTNFWLYNR